MRGSLRSWSGLILLALGACSNIIGVSEIEIDPSLDAPGSSGEGGTASGGKGSGGSTVIPQAGEENGGTSPGGAAQGGTSQGGTSGVSGSSGSSGEAGMGGEPPIDPDACAEDCDDEIACTVDECIEGECVHTTDDSACTPAAGKCGTCRAGIGCVDSEPIQKDLELLLDRNFDEQTGDWIDISDVDSILPDAAAQSGTHSVYFSPAAANAAETNLFDVVQEIHVPPGTVRLTASGWYKMIWAAEEKAGRPRNKEYVTLTLWSLEDENGDYTRYHDFKQWNANVGPAQPAWKSFTYEAPRDVLDEVQDLDITLDLVSETWDTKYYFDSLSLKAMVCE